MSKKLIITVEIINGKEIIKITDNAGNEKTLKSIMIFGGNEGTRQWYMFGMGASADAAWAVKEGMKRAWLTQDHAYMNFYKQMAAHIAQLLDPEAYQNEVDAEELINKWECEDQTKWALWDSEDVLIDKQKAEDKKYDIIKESKCICPIGSKCTCKIIH